MPTDSNMLLRLQDVSCSVTEDRTIFSGLDLTVNEGDVVALTGASGAGKTTLLKCIAHLSLYKGDLFFKGKKPTEYGVTTYRTKVSYVPQRPSMLPSTPLAFLRQVQSYRSRSKSNKNGLNRDDPDAAIEIASSWHIPEETWERPWSSLSGGEAQRCALAVACGLPDTEILLLDEPTSALDAQTAKLVEDYLVSLPGNESSNVKAIIWITHSEDQVKLTTRWLNIDGRLEEREVPAEV